MLLSTKRPGIVSMLTNTCFSSLPHQTHQILNTCSMACEMGSSKENSLLPVLALWGSLAQRVVVPKGHSAVTASWDWPSRGSLPSPSLEWSCLFKGLSCPSTRKAKVLLSLRSPLAAGSSVVSSFVLLLWRLLRKLREPTLPSSRDQQQKSERCINGRKSTSAS